MTARVQLPGESVIQYAMAKEKLLLMAPVTLTDGQKVQAMTEGLSDWKNQASILQAAPADIAEFYTACGALPASLSAPVIPGPVVAPSHPASAYAVGIPAEASSSLSAFTDQLVNGLAAKLEQIVIARTGGGSGYGRGGGGSAGRGFDPAGRGRGAGSGTGGGAVGRGFVPVSDRQCFQCGRTGHIARFCPEKK